MPSYPKNYQKLLKRFPELMKAHEEVGRIARTSGPLDEKTCHLIQLAAAIAARSEGGVHSHTRRAIAAGATRDEIYHVIALMISTVGFPSAAAAFSWVSDVIEKKR
jgi:4-carboxymuconolactone decarboxylase